MKLRQEEETPDVGKGKGACQALEARRLCLSRQGASSTRLGVETVGFETCPSPTSPRLGFLI